MIELGNGAIDEASTEWQRAHYSAWVIMSAPLVLGFDPLDTAKLDRLWPIIANREAIAINQNWAGHPGTRVMAWTPPGETRIDGTPLQAFQRSDDVYYTRAAIHTMQLWMKPQPMAALQSLSSMRARRMRPSIAPRGGGGAADRSSEGHLGARRRRRCTRVAPGPCGWPRVQTAALAAKQLATAAIAAAAAVAVAAAATLPAASSSPHPPSPSPLPPLPRVFDLSPPPSSLEEVHVEAGQVLGPPEAQPVDWTSALGLLALLSACCCAAWTTWKRTSIARSEPKRNVRRERKPRRSKRRQDDHLEQVVPIVWDED